MKAREAKAYESYKRSRMYNLYDAYGSFSEAKREAWHYCVKLCEEKNGYGLKVIGANTSQFSAGFMFEEDGIKKFMYITKESDTIEEIGKEEK